MTRVALLTAVALAIAAPASARQTNQQMPPAIVTRGDALLKRAPDQAWVAIAAESRAPTAADAQRGSAEGMKAVQTALGRAGLPGDAIRTTGYSVQPDMEYVNGRARVRGYIAGNQIEVRVDDLQKISQVIDAAGASGATSMSGLRFDLKNRTTVEREALKLAVQDAMARARAIAEGANATLGPIIRIDEHGDMPQPMPMYAARTLMADSAAPATPITPGEVEIRAQVTLTIAIR